MRILLVLALVVGWTAAFKFNFGGGGGNMPSFSNMFQPALPSKDSGPQTENQGSPVKKNPHFGAYRKRPNTGMWGEHGPEASRGGNRGDGPARPGRRPGGQDKWRRPNSSKDQKNMEDRRMKYKWMKDTGRFNGGSKGDRKGQMWGMDKDGEDCPMQNKTLDLMQLINETYHKMQELAAPLQDQAAPTANQTALMKDFARSFKRIMFHGPHGEHGGHKRHPRRKGRGKKGGRGKEMFDAAKLIKNIDVDEIMEGVKDGKIDMNKMMQGVDWSAMGDMMKKLDWNDLSSKMDELKRDGGLNGLTRPSSLSYDMKNMFPKSGGSNGFDLSKMMGGGGRKGWSQSTAGDSNGFDWSKMMGAGERKDRSMAALQPEPSHQPDVSNMFEANHQPGSPLEGSQLQGSQLWGNID